MDILLAAAFTLLFFLAGAIASLLFERQNRQNEKQKYLEDQHYKLASAVGRINENLKSLGVTDTFVRFLGDFLYVHSARSGHQHTDTDHGESYAYPAHTSGAAYPDEDADNSTQPLPDDNNGADGGVGVVHIVIHGQPGESTELYTGRSDVVHEQVQSASTEHANGNNDMDNVYGDDGRPYSPTGV